LSIIYTNAASVQLIRKVVKKTKALKLTI